MHDYGTIDLVGSWILRLTSHRLCCEIPTGLAGHHWEPVDVKPWNPYNVAWRVGQVLLRHGDS